LKPSLGVEKLDLIIKDKGLFANPYRDLGHLLKLEQVESHPRGDEKEKGL